VAEDALIQLSSRARDEHSLHSSDTSLEAVATSLRTALDSLKAAVDAGQGERVMAPLASVQRLLSSLEGKAGLRESWSDGGHSLNADTPTSASALRNERRSTRPVSRHKAAPNHTLGYKARS